MFNLSRLPIDCYFKGIAGAIYVAPSLDRPRPYHLITNDSLDIRQIREAERAIRHVIIQNHQHRDTVWKLLRMRVEGSEYYCYDSILVNGNSICPCVGQPKLILLLGREGSCALSSTWI